MSSERQKQSLSELRWLEVAQSVFANRRDASRNRLANYLANPSNLSVYDGVATVIIECIESIVLSSLCLREVEELCKSILWSKDV